MSPSPSTLPLLTSSDRPPPHPSAASIPSLLSSLTDPCSPPVTGRCVSTCQAPWQPHVPPHPLRGDRLPIRNAAVATLPAPPLYSPPPPPPPASNMISTETSAESLTKSFSLQTSHLSLICFFFFYFSSKRFFPFWPHQYIFTSLSFLLPLTLAEDTFSSRCPEKREHPVSECYSHLQNCLLS